MRHGEYIALGKIEAVLKTSSAVNNIVIYGSGDILMPVAVCIPVEKVVRQWAEELNVTGSFNELCQKEEIIKKMNQALLKECSKMDYVSFSLCSVAYIGLCLLNHY